MNIYYNPGDFGLEVVGDIEWRDCYYEFDFTAVWKESRGKYWVGSDSGCSCPSPFEDITDINELDGPYNKDGLRKRLDWLIQDHTENGYGTYPLSELKKSASDILRLLN